MNFCKSVKENPRENQNINISQMKYGQKVMCNFSLAIKEL